MTVQDALELLGVEAGADASAIRRAYARAVRRHPPDRDPEGFQRVRAALELLTTGHADEPPPPRPTPARPPPAEPRPAPRPAPSFAARRPVDVRALSTADLLQGLLGDDPIPFAAELSARGEHPRESAAALLRHDDEAPIDVVLAILASLLIHRDATLIPPMLALAHSADDRRAYPFAGRLQLIEELARCAGAHSMPLWVPFVRALALTGDRADGEALRILASQDCDGVDRIVAKLRDAHCNAVLARVGEDASPPVSAGFVAALGRRRGLRLDTARTLDDSILTTGFVIAVVAFAVSAVLVPIRAVPFGVPLICAGVFFFAVGLPGLERALWRGQRWPKMVIRESRLVALGYMFACAGFAIAIEAVIPLLGSAMLTIPGALFLSSRFTRPKGPPERP